MAEANWIRENQNNLVVVIGAPNEKSIKPNRIEPDQQCPPLFVKELDSGLRSEFYLKNVEVEKNIFFFLNVRSI